MLFVVVYKELNVEKMKSYDKLGELFAFIKSAGPELEIGSVYNIDFFGTVTAYHVGFNGRVVLVNFNEVINQ